MKNPALHTALIALAAFAAVAFVQRSVIAIPVVGAYLPGGVAAAATTA